MSELTLELVQAKQTELAEMIDALKREHQMTTLRIPAVDIALAPGEWYAGAVLNEDGSVKHHTIVAASDNDGRSFDSAQTWAAEQCYSAPTIQESRLIIANKASRLAGMSWFWTCEAHSNPAYAWVCNLGVGDVNNFYRSAEGGAVAVRRLSP